MGIFDECYYRCNKALNNGYFWIPIDINIYPKMFNFINIFYDICWFAISTFILIYGIIILVRAYE